MAKLIIDGREYPLVTVGSAKLLHMMELQFQGRDVVPGGLGATRIQSMERQAHKYRRDMTEWEAAKERGEDVDEPLAPDDAFLAMAVTVFLSRRGAGDKVSFTDALGVGMDAVLQVAEPTDGNGDPTEADGPDPTIPAGDDRATDDGGAPTGE